MKQKFKTYLTERLQITHPLIQAPMFLVTNVAMIKAAHHAGIIGCLPAHNYKTLEAFAAALKTLKDEQIRYGINLIVSESNPTWRSQMEVALSYAPSFIITSLGNPKEVILACKKKNIAVFCDIIDEHFAQKVEALGADALIAVNSGAGGHLGKISSSILIPRLKMTSKLPVIAAGGVAEASGLLSVLSLGAEGASIGSPFLATHEAPISNDYKNACIQYGAADIVVSTKISGTPCTVINTPYVQKIGTTQNFLERFLSKNKKLKKYVRMLTYYRGMKGLEKAAFGATYQSVWCAGPSIEFSDKIKSVQEVVDAIMQDTEKHYSELQKKVII